MELVQDKLNALQKKRSNLFNWRGQFTPEFVEYLLGNFTKKDDFVIDPFSGSGTVLQESARKDMSAEGFDINPSAYIMSKFFTFSNLDINQRWELLNMFELKLGIMLQTINGEKVYVENPDYREAYKSLISFGENFKKKLDESEIILLLNILFLSERDKTLTIKQSIFKSFMYLRNALLGLPHTKSEIKASLHDAREIHHVVKHKADLILTSPPYINVFNYHQNYRGLIEAFNFDILKVANSEFGSNRKNRANRFRTVVQYAMDMEEAIRSFWEVLKPDATLILVLGRQSNVRNTAFYNGQLVMDIVNKMGGFEESKTLERQFTNKFGIDIKEDILVYRKANNLKDEFYGKEIAQKHLELNLKNVGQDIKIDLEEAIRNIDNISSSPLFNLKNIITNA
jgi:DNA modification methylase